MDVRRWPRRATASTSRSLPCGSGTAMARPQLCRRARAGGRGRAGGDGGGHGPLLSSPAFPQPREQTGLPQERRFAVMALRCPALLLCLHWPSMSDYDPCSLTRERCRIPCSARRASHAGVSLFQGAAAEGDPCAMFNLGYMHLRGVGGPQVRQWQHPPSLCPLPWSFRSNSLLRCLLSYQGSSSSSASPAHVKAANDTDSARCLRRRC